MKDETSSASRKTGNIVISSFDRGIKDLVSSKGKNFAYLVNSYTYRRDNLPQKYTKKHTALEVLCKMNERVCKKASLTEVALSWKSLRTLAKELLEVRRQLKESSQLQK